MKSWRVHEYGAMDNLQLDDIPVPDPGPGEVRIKLAYAALNPADAYLIKGQYPGRGEPPLCPGRDGSGVVDATGGDGRFQPGDRVIVLRGPTGVSRDGTLAEFVTVPECNVAPLPPGWSFKEAPRDRWCCSRRGRRWYWMAGCRPEKRCWSPERLAGWARPQ